MIKYTIDYVASLEENLLKNTDSYTHTHKFVFRKLNIFNTISNKALANDQLNNVFENIKGMNIRCLMFDPMQSVSMAKTLVFLKFSKIKKNKIIFFIRQRVEIISSQENN